MKIRYIIILFSCLIFSTFQLWGQKEPNRVKISGMVLDDAKAPVAGAIITIDGVQTYNSTKKNGTFKIKVNHSAEKVGVLISESSVIEEPIKGRTKMEIIIPVTAHQVIIDQQTPPEETINIGYGSVKKKDLLNNVDKLESDQKKFSGYSDIFQLIQGKFPGVQVNGTSIKIQNSVSIIGSTEPLLVVDGLIVDSIRDIPPNEVQSIEVLKGPAASIYGSRGANGVILITLRK